MAFGHEKLDVYRAAIASLGWAYRHCEKRKGHRSAKAQLLRASLACAAIQAVLPVCDAMSADDNRKQKALLDPSLPMLAKLGQRGDAIREALGESGVGQFDTDTDSDTD